MNELLKMSKGNKKLKNTLIFDLPAGKTCPMANECKSYVVMNDNGKTSIKDGNTNSLRKRIYAILTRPRKNIYFYAVSEFVKKTWIDYSGINSERIKVIYDAINLPEKQFDKNEIRYSLRKELKLKKNSKIALCVGRIVSYRRQDFLIEVFSHKKISKDLVLLIVGEPAYSVPSTKNLVLK